MNQMPLTPAAEKALLLWSHYQEMILTDNFRNHVHKKYIRTQEEKFRELFLFYTEDQAEIVMNAAGCVLIKGSFKI